MTIACFDSSAFVKLLIDEPGISWDRRLAGAALETGLSIAPSGF